MTSGLRHHRVFLLSFTVVLTATVRRIVRVFPRARTSINLPEILFLEAAVGHSVLLTVNVKIRRKALNPMLSALGQAKCEAAVAVPHVAGCRIA